MSSGAWTTLALMIGYLAVMTFSVLIISVRQERFDVAAGAALMAAFFTFMFFRLWAEARARAPRER